MKVFEHGNLIIRESADFTLLIIGNPGALVSFFNLSRHHTVNAGVEKINNIQLSINFSHIADDWLRALSLRART